MRQPWEARIGKLCAVVAAMFLASLLYVPLYPVLAFGYAALLGATIVFLGVALSWLAWGIVSLPGAVFGLLRRTVALRARRA